jgi:hypothetical protein
MSAPAVAGAASSLSVARHPQQDEVQRSGGWRRSDPRRLIGIGILAGVIVLIANHENDDDQPDSN